MLKDNLIKLIRKVTGDDQGECWTGQHARGSWHDHDELAHAVARHNQSMETNQAAYRLSGNHWVVIDNRNGRPAANGFANINTGLIAQGGGNTVSQGGGNVAGSNGIFYTLLAPFNMLSRPDKSIQMPLKLGGAERALAALQPVREGGSVTHKGKVPCGDASGDSVAGRSPYASPISLGPAGGSGQGACHAPLLRHRLIPDRIAAECTIVAYRHLRERFRPDQRIFVTRCR